MIFWQMVEIGGKQIAVCGQCGALVLPDYINQSAKVGTLTHEDFHRQVEQAYSNAALNQVIG